MARTRWTSRCVKCGGKLAVEYSLPIDEHGPYCAECAAKEPKKEEPKPSPIEVPF